MAQLLYGSGLRLMECVRLRVKDLDFSYHQITVRDGKGEKDRLTILPTTLVTPLQAQLRATRHLHAADLALGYGRVHLPHALASKYPNAATDWRWQYVFGASQRSKDPRSGAIGRHHIGEDGLQRAVVPRSLSWLLIISSSGSIRMRPVARTGASGRARARWVPPGAS